MNSRKLIKRALFPVLAPLSRRYLRKVRRYTYDGLKVQVFPGVFHPGLFISTKLLLGYLKDQSLAGKRILELGAGTGLIALFAARQGAIASASDISEQAVLNIQANAQALALPLQVFHSDLFVKIPRQVFDLLIINPPYYPQYPKTEAEFAWYCGEHFEYFFLLFEQIGPYIHAHSTVWMILSEDCDREHIQNIARQAGYTMKEIWRQRKWGEWNFLYQISTQNSVS